MLDKLKAALGAKTEAPKLEVKLTAEDVTAAVQAAVAELRGEFDTYKTTADAAMAEAAEKITGLQGELADMAGKLVEANAALAAATTEKADAEAAAQAAKLNARKEKVLGIVGTERAEALLKATDGMEDTAFEAIVAALGTGAAAEAATPLFKEVGADVSADSAAVTETPEMKRLKAKYGDSAKRQ